MRAKVLLSWLVIAYAARASSERTFSALAGGMGQAGDASCQRGTLVGEVREGQGYRRLIGNGLAMVLQPIASGWIVRVVPAAGARIEHDYAELATPPYNSVTPLSISTDFSFRAQDAVGWNPRDFRFATSKKDYERLLSAYDGLGAPGSAPSVAAAQEMVGLLGKAAHGRLKILDARLVPGTADQWRMAGAVASHFSSTAHTVDQSAAPSRLGKIEWMRFQIEMEVGSRFAADPEARLIAGPCDW